MYSAVFKQVTLTISVRNNEFPNAFWVKKIDGAVHEEVMGERRMQNTVLLYNGLRGSSDTGEFGSREVEDTLADCEGLNKREEMRENTEVAPGFLLRSAVILLAEQHGEEEVEKPQHRKSLAETF